MEDGDRHRRPGGETIILKRLNDPGNYWDEGGLEQYADTPDTERYRHELETINQWLAAADLRFEPLGVPWPHTSFDIRDRRVAWCLYSSAVHQRRQI